MQKLWNIDEVARFLGIDHDDVKALVERGLLPAYRIAGSFLRFDPAVVEAKRPSLVKEVASAKEKPAEIKLEYAFQDRLKDFFYFNDFYLISTLIIVILLVLIFKS